MCRFRFLSNSISFWNIVVILASLTVLRAVAGSVCDQCRSFISESLYIYHVCLSLFHYEIQAPRENFPAISLQRLVHCFIKGSWININSGWKLRAILHYRFMLSLKIICRIMFIQIIFHRIFQLEWHVPQISYSDSNMILSCHHFIHLIYSWRVYCPWTVEIQVLDIIEF